MRSPQAGQILRIHTRPGEVVGQKGIVELGQTAQMYAVAEVYETDISRVGKKDVLGTDPAADAFHF